MDDKLLRLNLETLQAIGSGGDIPALIQEIGDYKGPTALLRDAAGWLVGRKNGVKPLGQSWTRRVEGIGDREG